MQDRYTGDIGDFGKYALLKALAGNDLRLAVAWYLNPYEERSTDGKFTKYLADENEKHYRHADPGIYDGLKKIVRNCDRRICLVRKYGILPPNTIFYEVAFDYLNFSLRSDRKGARDRWLQGALDETEKANLVFFDPDNGLEVKSRGPCTKLGAKYVFEAEIQPFLDRNQSIVVYQHMNRSGRIADQARKSIARLRNLAMGREGWAISFHRYSVRIYLVLPSAIHTSILSERSRRFERGPGKNVFGVELHGL